MPLGPLGSQGGAEDTNVCLLLFVFCSSNVHEMFMSNYGMLIYLHNHD